MLPDEQPDDVALCRCSCGTLLKVLALQVGATLECPSCSTQFAKPAGGRSTEPLSGVLLSVMVAAKTMLQSANLVESPVCDHCHTPTRKEDGFVASREIMLHSDLAALFPRMANVARLREMNPSATDSELIAHFRAVVAADKKPSLLCEACATVVFCSAVRNILTPLEQAEVWDTNAMPREMSDFFPDYQKNLPAEIAMISHKAGYQFPKSRKPSFGRKWWRWLYRWLLKPLCITCLVLIIILLSVGGIVLIVKNVGIIAKIIVLGLVAFLGIIAFTLVLYPLIKGINYLIETHDLREAKRDERYAVREKRLRRKKQTQLNRDSERIASAIKKQLDSQEPLENILPNICTKDYEVIAKAISSIDSLKDTEKGCLFNNMDPDFIFRTLTYFKDSEKITILQKLEPRKREDVLMRFPLPQRSRLK